MCAVFGYLNYGKKVNHKVLVRLINELAKAAEIHIHKLGRFSQAAHYMGRRTTRIYEQVCFWRYSNRKHSLLYLGSVRQKQI